MNPSRPLSSESLQLIIRKLVQLEVDVRSWYITALLEVRSSEKPVHPAFDVGKLINLRQATVLYSKTSVSSDRKYLIASVRFEQLQRRPTVRGGPWPDGDVSNGEVVTDKVSRWVLGQRLVHGSV